MIHVTYHKWMSILFAICKQHNLLVVSVHFTEQWKTILNGTTLNSYPFASLFSWLRSIRMPSGSIHLHPLIFLHSTVSTDRHCQQTLKTHTQTNTTLSPVITLIITCLQQQFIQLTNLPHAPVTFTICFLWHPVRIQAYSRRCMRS
jgi:hypothetical protein